MSILTPLLIIALAIGNICNVISIHFLILRVSELEKGTGAGEKNRWNP